MDTVESRHPTRYAQESGIEVDDADSASRKVSQQRKSSEARFSMAGKCSDLFALLNSLTGEFAALCQRVPIEPKLVVIGGGYMGAALVRGFISRGV